ncbi:hypothetical protein KIPB_014109, partial [Kipferlia bialata]|eukprot:g14109.t1
MYVSQSGLSLSDCTFENCDLSLCKLTEVTFSDVTFDTHCSFEGAKFTDAILCNVNMGQVSEARPALCGPDSSDEERERETYRLNHHVYLSLSRS